MTIAAGTVAWVGGAVFGEAGSWAGIRNLNCRALAAAFAVRVFSNDALAIVRATWLQTGMHNPPAISAASTAKQITAGQCVVYCALHDDSDARRCGESGGKSRG